MLRSSPAGALDLLAYRRECAPVLDAQDGPYGLGFAWGRGLEPTAEAEVTVCTPDTLDDALDDALAALLEETHPLVT